METAIRSIIDFFVTMLLDALTSLGIRQPAPEDKRPVRALSDDRDARSRRPLYIVGLALALLVIFGILFEIAGPGSADQFVFHFDRDKLVRAAIDIRD